MFHLENILHEQKKYNYVEGTLRKCPIYEVTHILKI